MFFVVGVRILFMIGEYSEFKLQLIRFDKYFTPMHINLDWPEEHCFKLGNLVTTPTLTDYMTHSPSPLSFSLFYSPLSLLSHLLSIPLLFSLVLISLLFSPYQAIGYMQSRLCIIYEYLNLLILITTRFVFICNVKKYRCIYYTVVVQNFTSLVQAVPYAA